MSLRRTIAQMDVAEVRVAAFCRDHGVSRDRLYAIRRRYQVEGDAGLTPRCRTPHTVANRTSPMLEDGIRSCEFRDTTVEPTTEISLAAMNSIARSFDPTGPFDVDTLTHQPPNLS